MCVHVLMDAALDYTPTSTMFLNIPSISKLQWHPFTVISNSSLEAETISVMIKCQGSWTKKLYDALSSPAPAVDRLEVSIEGPYGPPPSANFLLRFISLCCSAAYNFVGFGNDSHQCEKSFLFWVQA